MSQRVQILTGFLLTVPFTNKFGTLTRSSATATWSPCARGPGHTALIIAPAAFHRTLFRRGEKAWRSLRGPQRARRPVSPSRARSPVWCGSSSTWSRTGRPVSIAGSVALVLFVLLWACLL